MVLDRFKLGYEKLAQEKKWKFDQYYKLRRRYEGERQGRKSLAIYARVKGFRQKAVTRVLAATRFKLERYAESNILKQMHTSRKHNEGKARAKKQVPRKQNSRGSKV